MLRSRAHQTSRDGLEIVRRAIVVIVLTAVAAGCQTDCIHGQSIVELRLPSTSWLVDAFCVEDRCLPAGARRPGPEDVVTTGIEEELPPGETRAPGPFISYVIDVGDEPASYAYLVELTAPDGTHFVHQGDVVTAGNDMGGEGCRPTSATASLTVAADGQLTVQSP